MTTKNGSALIWYKVASLDELPEGRVKTVTAGHKSIALTHYDGRYGALDNRCPHQGGPLGEGSIEKGLLRCPWHGWDYCPLTGQAPGFEDSLKTFPIEERSDGVYIGVEPDAPRKRTVGDVVAETLTAWGVRWVFGMVGHSNLGMAEAIRVQEEQGKMSYIGVRHEGAASFAVSAYGKLTGRPAACLAIAGPGATNLLTGLWDANVDRSPAIALTGQVEVQVLGTGAFQEIDLQAAYGKVAQWTQPLLPRSNHAELVNLACKSAILNRGVSHMILPDETPKQLAKTDIRPGQPEGRVAGNRIHPPDESLDAAIRVLQEVRRPVIVAGYGARFQMDSVVELAEMLRSPIITTFKAKGVISDTHPLAGGVLGRSGTPVASWLMNESDCLLVFGASFSDHTGIHPKIRTIQVDFDPLALGKFHSVEVPVWGEIGVTAHLMCEMLKDKHQTEDQRPDVKERQRLWREEKRSRLKDDLGRGVNSASVFETMTRLIPEDAVIAVDVGNNTYSFGRYFECRRQAVLMSGYLGSIGFALPAAMGAWAATQEDDLRFRGRKVVSVSGDGGLGQYMAELTTAVKYSMDITHVLLNNGELGKISKEQRAGEWEVWQTSLHNPDFAKYAELCGAYGRRVEKREELDTVITEALEHNGPALVEIITDPELI